MARSVEGPFRGQASPQQRMKQIVNEERGVRGVGTVRWRDIGGGARFEEGLRKSRIAGQAGRADDDRSRHSSALCDGGRRQRAVDERADVYAIAIIAEHQAVFVTVSADDDEFRIMFFPLEREQEIFRRPDEVQEHSRAEAFEHRPNQQRFESIAHGDD
ncbi:MULTISPECIES: hypothetical protein [unclassified Methylosinus]|uniref:hypothetical protein n=1 Tax=unclassified Methylosinus TaxID=2624500 RepID=UPI0012ED7149|nr:MULTISPECIES: hypothetical protein [unclassified Methylosinus]